MGARTQIEKKIQAKTVETAELEARIKENNAYIQALQEVIRLLPKDESEGQGSEHNLRAGSAVARARELLLKSGKPLHITEILKGIGKENTKSQRLSVSGSLRNYARKGMIFRQDGGNTFSLVEFKSRNGGGKTPPEGFGLVLEDDEESAA
ncbi:MAG: hypothetical protein M3R52_06095 [Acidobacteriota bacterium]|nr:hypothetical protein [Acidobacteriota bacterium]